MGKPKPLKLVPTDLYETSPERYYSTYSMDPYIAELKASLDDMTSLAEDHATDYEELWGKRRAEQQKYMRDAIDRAQALLKEVE